MGEFFGSIYCWLDEFFGIELADYLWGISSPQQVSNMYIGIGLTMLGITLAIMILFYYILNHPKLNNWWGWGIFWVLNAIANFIVGWQWVLKDFYAGKMVKSDATTGELVDLNIYHSDMLAFGVTNMINAMIAYILFSYMFKWWSSNCSHAPF